jgi:hypothetical protein
LDDFKEGKEILRAADMKNVLTEESNHNLSTLDQLQEKFSQSRRDFLTKLASLDDATLMSKVTASTITDPDATDRRGVFLC